jgi:hypothetical protein
MAGIRAQLFKLVLGNQASLGKPHRFWVLERFKHNILLKLCHYYYISDYIKIQRTRSTLFLSYYPKTSVLPINTFEDWLEKEMPPKAKRSASAKVRNEMSSFRCYM